MYLLHLLKPFGGEFFLHYDFNIYDYKYFQYFIGRCYIGGQVFVLDWTL